MTKLSHVEIRPNFHRKTPIAAYFGDRRVVYEIPGEALDDYFLGRPHLTDEQRLALLRSNVEAIAAVMQTLCEREAWRRTNRGEGWFWLLDFDPGDLKLGDHKLSVEEKSAEREGE
jgi:hypothetical protein